MLLRERHGVKGEIRAVGYLIPDLAPFLLRSGFDTAEITDANDVETWKRSLAKSAISISRASATRSRFAAMPQSARQRSSNARLAASSTLPTASPGVRRSVEGRIVF